MEFQNVLGAPETGQKLSEVEESAGGDGQHVIREIVEASQQREGLAGFDGLASGQFDEENEGDREVALVAGDGFVESFDDCQEQQQFGLLAAQLGHGGEGVGFPGVRLDHPDALHCVVEQLQAVVRDGCRGCFKLLGALAEGWG